MIIPGQIKSSNHAGLPKSKTQQENQVVVVF